MLNDNLLLLTDSYKTSHYKQYPAGTTKIHSYFESRGGEFNEICFFGLQYIIKRYLEPVITYRQIEKAKRRIDAHMGPGVFNEKGWVHIVEKHGGHLPLEIKAVPEGTVVPTGNVVMTVENTDPENTYWLTNYVETLGVQVWYPSTVATISREGKKLLKSALEKSAEDEALAGLPFKLHDFGCRGVSCMEQAAIGGAAHLVNFQGTDTLPCLDLLEEFYDAGPAAGFSINAAEHSTITSWGEKREVDAYRNMLTQYPDGLVAVVSDSYDIDNAVKRIWGRVLKKEVLGRKGVLVIRPDSGEPCETIVRLLNLLGQEFQCETNSKGYKMLPPQIRMIWGDGINRYSLGKILSAIMASGWSIDNLAFGSGGGLLMDCNRDTSMYAFKCSHAMINGDGVDVFKNPKTASWKASKKGRLALVKDAMLGYRTVLEKDLNGQENVLRTVFKDGKIHNWTTLQEIRERAKL